MDDGRRRALFAILAGLALAGLVVMIVAITLTPPGLQWWLYGALALVLIALIAEVILLLLTRGGGKPERDEQYDFVIGAEDNGEAR